VAQDNFMEWSKADREAGRVPEKVAVDGTCPECGAADLARYPVLSADGWFIATKCQKCLCTVTRERWNRLGWVQLPEDQWAKQVEEQR
jgi:hypothetical protein